jgi:hypothetical protein
MRTDEEWCVRLFERAESFQDLPEWVEKSARDALPT